MLATGSVDQTENYVFVVEPQGVGKSFGKAGHYWISANDFDTMYSLFNPADRAQDFIATIYYGDGSGSYQMPVHLEAQASTMIDMMMLIGERVPNVHGFRAVGSWGAGELSPPAREDPLTSAKR